jgi:hypothetical protein
MAFPTGVAGSAAVASLPAFFELIGAVAVLCISKGIPLRVQAALQNFSAGIIIAAIGGSIFPLLEEKVALSGCGFLGFSPECPLPGEVKQADEVWQSVLGIVIGFTVALLLMYTVKNCAEEGPQYQEEMVLDDLLDESNFIGLDEVPDEVPAADIGAVAVDLPQHTQGNEGMHPEGVCATPANTWGTPRPRTRPASEGWR